MPVHRHPIAPSRADEPLTGIPLDQGLIQRLEASYQRLRVHDVRLAEVFYAKLFQAAPHVRGMFSADVREQARKLTLALDAIVTNLRRPADNAAMLAAMGKRHAAYGAKPEHYELVTDLLIESMRELLGSEADDRTLAEWRIALRLVSRHMVAGAAGAQS